MLLSPSPYAAIYPRQYIAYRSSNNNPHRPSSTADEPCIPINGDLNKPFWNDIPWTEDFVDISTTDTIPSQRTMVKMRWDDHFLFVGARIEETDVWATLQKDNSVIFHDNDFEIFVDCEGSNHNYKEYEINAFGTTWTLLLDKPYDDGGGEDSKRVDPVNGYDMSPFSATKVYPNNDAINRPDVKNTHWTVEVALPISKLMERNQLAKRPSDGHHWRINFSRVQWGVKVNKETGKYEKNPCCETCAVPGTAAEDNWTWSPQGSVAMHLPERWGILQFSSSTSPKDDDVVLLEYKEWDVRCCAMALYYAQKGYSDKEGKYTDLIERLEPFFNEPFLLHSAAEVHVTLIGEEGFSATAKIGAFTATINQERYLVVSEDDVLSPSLTK